MYTCILQSEQRAEQWSKSISTMCLSCTVFRVCLCSWQCCPPSTNLVDGMQSCVRTPVGNRCAGLAFTVLRSPAFAHCLSRARVSLWRPCSTGCAVALQVWHADGFKGFYKGCGTNLLRTTPAAALTFTSFELINRQIKIYAQAKRQHRIDELANA